MLCPASECTIKQELPANLGQSVRIGVCANQIIHVFETKNKKTELLFACFRLEEGGNYILLFHLCSFDEAWGNQ